MLISTGISKEILGLLSDNPIGFPLPFNLSIEAYQEMMSVDQPTRNQVLGGFPLPWLVGGLVAINYIFPYGNNRPNGLSYFSEGWPNHQPAMIIGGQSKIVRAWRKGYLISKHNIPHKPGRFLALDWTALKLTKP